MLNLLPVNGAIKRPLKAFKSGEAFLRGHRVLFFSLMNLVVFVLYIVPPLAFFASPGLRRNLIFMNYINFRFNNFTSPKLENAHNFYVESDEGVHVGVWHVRPRESDDIEADRRPVILYLHGSGGTRASLHRQSLYRVLTGPDVDVHVIAPDYRGFGDSTNRAVTANGVVTDAMAVYRWLLSRGIDRRRIFVWGHSMGSGVATRIVSQMPSHVLPSGIILEAPFTSMADAIATHPLTLIYRFLPFFRDLFVEAVKDDDTYFDNEATLANIHVPLLFLHAEDDELVDFKFSQILFQKSNSLVSEFVRFNASDNYGHKYICKDPRLPEKLVNFFKKAKRYHSL